MRLSVLMTVFREVDFVDYAIRSCLPYVDDLVIVEGSYQQNRRLGLPARSDDGTIEIIEKYRNDPKVHIIYANEESDFQQRNKGLEIIKKINPNGWFEIIDGDEIIEPNTFTKIKQFCINADKEGVLRAVYFQSITFVNDLKHYTIQEFPRLFKITSECEFFNDNYLRWTPVDFWDFKFYWDSRYVIKRKDIKYFHYSFVKGLKKFQEKRNWWMSRGLGKDFDYGWKIDENGKITDKNHQIYLYSGKHPDIMKSHPLMGKGENKNGY